MAASSVARNSQRGPQDLLLRQLFGTGQIGRIQSLPGRTSVGLASRSELLATATPRGTVALQRTQPVQEKLWLEKGTSSEGRRQELLWRQFFMDQTLWWDNRQHKKSSHSPDFRHKKSPEVLWLKSFYKPAWVDVQLAALDMQIGRRTPTSNSTLSADPDPRRPAEYELGLTAETVSKLCQQGQLSEAVEALGVLVEAQFHISTSLCYAILKQCVAKKDLVLGRRVHTLTVAMGYESDTFLCNHIVRMYASHAMLQEAMDVFSMVLKPDAFMWSSIISAHVKHGQAKQAIQLYHQMRSSGVKADGHVFVAALQACASRADLKTGLQVHADVLASGVQPELFVSNCLVDMYAKCGSWADARRIFDSLAAKDVVTWNAMIAAYAQQGMGQEALTLYSSMQQQGTSPSSVTFVGVLQACASVGVVALQKGKDIHAQVDNRGLQGDVTVGGSLVNMYAKCGSLDNAIRLFDQISRKNVVTWNAMIAGYAQQGMGSEALALYNRMQQEGTSVPDSVTFVSLLQACASVGIRAMEKGKQLHAQIEERGLQADVVLSCSLVNMYAKCGCLEDAQRVFDLLCQKNVVTWNAMISGYVRQGMCQEAFSLYSRMQQEGMATPNSVTFVCLLHGCASMGITAMEKGKQLHAQIQEQGLQADVFVANSLINMYAKCGSLEDARGVFDGIPQNNVVTWNAMLAGYAQRGMGQEALDLYGRMRQEGIIGPDSATFVSLLQACASVGITAMEKGRQLHAQIEEQKLQSDVVVANCLINMYAKGGCLEDARSVFDRLPQKDVVTWNTIIAGYAQRGMGQEALSLYNKMQQEGSSSPSSVTFLCLLQACASVGIIALEKGRELHAKIEEQGVQADVSVANSLITMYAKCGSLKDAQIIFDRLSEKDVVTWTAMIAGYSQQGMGQEALCLYSDMEGEGISAPDSVTFVCLLEAFASVGITAFKKGKQLHAQIEERGLLDMVVGCSLVNMYAKCGSLGDAKTVFDRISEKNVVTWNAMIAGYAQHGMGQEALNLYSRMQEDIAAPNSVTFVCLLQACASVGTAALERGKQLHAQIEERGLQADVVVANSLINMYAKCGCLGDAQSVFDLLDQKDVVTWNAMIAGYAERGMGHEALSLYNGMQQEGIAAPDSVTFVCLLQACASVAALHPGRQLHAEIEEQGLQADAFVANSLINMYSKSGSMVDAQQVFDALPERDIVAWNALIAGYTRHGDSDVVFDLVHKMIEDCIQPDDITLLSVLTVCSHVGLVNKGREYFDAMTRNYGITPTVEHYTCMVDILGRAGQLEDALVVVRTMPVQPHDVVWHTLLGACRKWCNVEVGRHAFNEAVKLDKTDVVAYVMMSNIYTGAQMWKEAQEMQAMRKKIGAQKQPGQSWWTDVGGKVHAFVAGDEKYLESAVIYARLKQLVPTMKKEGYVPISPRPWDIADDEKEAHLCL